MGKPFKEQSAGAITNFFPPQVIFLMLSWYRTWYGAGGS